MTRKKKHFKFVIEARGNQYDIACLTLKNDNRNLSILQEIKRTYSNIREELLKHCEANIFVSKFICTARLRKLSMAWYQNHKLAQNSILSYQIKAHKTKTIL